MDVFPSRVSELILKSFVAEGASYNHHLYIASGKVLPSVFAEELPSLKSAAAEKQLPTSLDSEPLANSDENLKIAWRYQHQDKGISDIGKPKSIVDSKFDFSKKTSVKELGGKHVFLSQAFENMSNFENVSSSVVMNEICSFLKSFIIEEKPSNVARVCLSHCEEILNHKFMLNLKTLARSTNSAVVICLNNLSVLDEVSARCEYYCDLVVTLKSITDDSHKSDLGDIDGLCTVNKLSSAFSFKTSEVPKELGFSFKKKKMYFHVSL